MLNGTMKDQDVTAEGGDVFEVVKVERGTCTSCSGPITRTPGGTVGDRLVVAHGGFDRTVGNGEAPTCS